MHDFFGLIRLLVIAFFIILIVGLCKMETGPAEGLIEIPSSCLETESL